MLKKIICFFYSKFYILYLFAAKKCFFGQHGYISFDSKFGGNNRIGKYANIVHSTIGYGSNISDYSDLCYIKIGKYCSIGKYFSTAVGTHPTQNFVSTHPAFYSINKDVSINYVNKQKFEEYNFIENKNIKVSVLVGNDVWIGNNVAIVGKPKGITIGNGAVIGTGSVITHNIPDYAIVVGVPAKIIKYRFNPLEIIFLKELNWWDKDKKWLIKYGKYFENIKLLKQKIKEGI